ncbi:MAG: hypothetical protein RIQ70_233 [Bacteroidota bacterium]
MNLRKEKLVQTSICSIHFHLIKLDCEKKNSVKSEIIKLAEIDEY